MGKRKLAQSLEGEVNEKDATMKASEGGASDEEIAVEVKVIGELVKKSGGKGKVDKKCYHAFEVDGNRYDIVRATSLLLSMPLSLVPPCMSRFATFDSKYFVKTSNYMEPADGILLLQFSFFRVVRVGTLDILAG
jgi:hypothetical protein